MTENLRESISALMDDEANELEVHRVLANMEQSNEVRDTWKRFQLASMAMKGRLPEHIDFDISESVAAAIADEEVELESVRQKGSSGRWGAVLKPLTSVAVAASVAFAVVFGALQFNRDGTGGVPGLAEQSMPDVSETLLAGAATDLRDVVPVSEEQLTPTQKKLRDLMDTHTQQVDISRGRAFMPYAQLVNDSESRRY